MLHGLRSIFLYIVHNLPIIILLLFSRFVKGVNMLFHDMFNFFVFPPPELSFRPHGTAAAE